MSIFAQVSGLTPKENNTTYNVRQQQTNASKTKASHNTSTKYGSASEIVDVVSISENAKKMIAKSYDKSSGSIEINNRRIKYSLTENNDLIIKIIDKKSDEVIRQIPPEEMVKIKEMLAKILEQELEV